MREEAGPAESYAAAFGRKGAWGFSLRRRNEPRKLPRGPLVSGLRGRPSQGPLPLAALPSTRVVAREASSRRWRGSVAGETEGGQARPGCVVSSGKFPPTYRVPERRAAQLLGTVCAAGSARTSIVSRGAMHLLHRSFDSRHLETFRFRGRFKSTSFKLPALKCHTSFFFWWLG